MHPIAFIGFGEAAGAFAQGWGPALCAQVTGWDEKLDTPALAAPMRARAAALGVTLAASRAEALASARHVFSLVTADRAVEAAGQAVGLLAPGALWLDANSCAPDSKAEAARLLAAQGVGYVDVAVMAPVHPRLHESPLVISGADAARAGAFLRGLGMKPRLLDDRIGSASALKMIRSVMIKGMEALTAECLLAARRAGVEAEVLASLAASNPEIDWPERAAYNLERMMQHGTRRAAEMREVARTVAGLGLPEGLSAATAVWQDRIGALNLKDNAGDLDERLARILAAL